MTRIKIAIVCVVLIAASVFGATVMKAERAGAMQSMHVAQASSNAGCGSWSVVNSPNPGKSDNALGAVAAVSHNDVWAVGEFLRTGATSITQTLTEHWDGNVWTYIPSPNVGALGNTLYGVSASSASDAWAVGFYTDSNFLSHTLAEHWNGKQWSIISTPNPGSSYDNLFGVADISSTNAWAVGFYRDGGDSNPTRTLIEHWNGTQWSIVSSPNPGSSGNLLYGISAVSASNIWAVGQFFTNSPDLALVEHWDGSQWNVVHTPGTGTASNALFAIAASPQSTWSVGRIESDITPSTTLTEQWNGNGWHISFSPGSGSSDNNLYAVSSVSVSDAWAAGNFIDKGGNAQTLIEHWNGSQWSTAVSPSPGKGGDNILGGIVAISTNDVWAVGGDDSGGPTHTLIEHYC